MSVGHGKRFTYLSFLLRLVTLENSPCITPELLRIFQNMSPLLGMCQNNNLLIYLLGHYRQL